MSTAPHTNMSEKKRGFKNIIHLWEFLLELLNNGRYASIICWTIKESSEFKIIKQDEVARLWGSLKQRKGMNYDKLSRSLRYYYNKKIIEKVSGQRLVYRFMELPFEYLPLRNMNQATRRQQLRGYPTNINSQAPAQSDSTVQSYKKTKHEDKPNPTPSSDTRDPSTNGKLSFPPRVVSRSQIFFPSGICSCVHRNILPSGHPTGF